MDKELLRYYIKKNGDTAQSLSEYLGIRRQSLYQKMSETGSEFKLSEIRAISKRYNLNAMQMNEIFFNLEVS